MRFFILILSFVGLASVAFAQNYTFEPGSAYYGTLEMEMYTEHYMYIGHDLQDSAYITWRLVENTCPEEWDIQACDYQHCYTGLPNYGDMNAVPVGGQGYLRMIVNPFQTAGQGMLHFLIYPTGEPLNYTDAYYYFSTTAVSIQGSQTEQESVQVLANEIVYAGPIFGDVVLYDMNGNAVASTYWNASGNRISLNGLASGIYILSTPTRRTFRIVKPH